jgi:hypothetical protein
MAKKTITVGGSTYEVPEGYDPSIYQSQLDIEGRLKEQLQKTKTLAEQAPRSLELEQAASQADLRQQAARALGSSRALAGGGRGIGLARDVAESAGVASGKMRADFADRIAQARQDAAAVGLQTMVEEGKLLEAAASRKAAGANAKSRIDAIIETYKGAIYTTNDDKKRMVRELEKERDAAVNPQAANAFQNAIDNINRGNLDVAGSIDLDF